MAKIVVLDDENSLTIYPDKSTGCVVVQCKVEYSGDNRVLLNLHDAIMVRAVLDQYIKTTEGT